MPATILVKEGSPVNFTSPLYPEEYPPDVDCTHTITAEEGFKIMVEFVVFDIERRYDVLYFEQKEIFWKSSFRFQQLHFFKQ